MKGARRRRFGMLALAVLFSPWLGTTLIAIHLSFDDNHDADYRAGDFAAAFHGHRHEPGTPDHDHVVIQPAPHSLAARSWFVAVASVGAAFDPAELAAPTMRPVVRWIHQRGLSPPPRDPAPRVLRI